MSSAAHRRDDPLATETVIVDGERLLPAVVEVWHEADGWHVRVTGSSIDIEARASDAYSALSEIRATLEADDQLLAVNGSRIDCHPSGMSIDMGAGLRIYHFGDGEPALVDTFAAAPPDTVGTVDQQRVHFAAAGRRSPRPEITEAMRRHAVDHPDTWLYCIAAGFDPDGDVPGEAIKGAYRVDAQGNVTDEYRANPNYRPTPAERGMPEPASKLEDIAQKVATGWAGRTDLIEGIRRTDVIVGHRHGRVIEVYSSEAQAAAAHWAGTETVAGESLAATLDEADRIQLDPVSASPIMIEATELAGDGDL